MTFTIPGAPVAKPRMTRRDKWKLRPCVLAYRDFCDRALTAAGLRRKMRLSDPIIVTVTAYFGFPRSSALSVQRSLRNSPHTGRQDADNVLKAINERCSRTITWSAGRQWKNSGTTVRGRASR